MMPFNPDMKPARRRRTGDNDHRRRGWRGETNFNLLHLNSNRLAGDNNTASHNNDNYKTKDI
jgi:hypothetical protein